jgi:lipopolysaccharide assembly outer membrane protein LptD (OstA)
VGRWLITEPVVQGILAPHQGTARKIPNIDCLGFEFNDTVLLRHNRLPGYDQVDAGNRVTYGVTLLPTPAFLQTTRFFVGQTYAFGKPAGDLYSGGMTPKASDVVGSLQTDPHEWVSFDYRFRLSRRNLRPVFSEVFYGLGPSVFRLGTSYLRSSPSHASNSLQKQQPEVHQLSLSLSSKFHRDWSAEIVQLRNLHKKELLSQGARVVFQNECVSASMFIGRSYYRGGGIKPSTSFLFTVALKNLGGGTLKPGGNAEARRL